MTNKRTYMKAWPLVFVCLNTSAVKIQLCPGYSTEDLMLELKSFFANNGVPKYICSDPGTQMVAAKKLVEVSKHTSQQQLKFDLEKVAQDTASKGIEWHIVPTESQWKNGRSERAIQSIKRTLKHLHSGKCLNFRELQVLLERASDAINSRPLGVRHNGGAEPNYAPVTPNLLLKCRRSQYYPGDMALYYEPHEEDALRLKEMEEAFDSWWRAWFADVFDSLIPAKRWKDEHPNLVEGDLCMMVSQQKFAKPTYKICKVSKVFKDEHGLVRTVKVLSRPRDIREPVLPYLSKQLVSQTVPVQRLVLVLPLAEQKLISTPPSCASGPAVPAPKTSDPAVSPPRVATGPADPTPNLVPADTPCSTAGEAAVTTNLVEITDEGVWPEIPSDNQFYW